MKTVLVTGSGGQLGKCLQEITAKDSSMDWLFMDSSEVDISSHQDLQQVFSNKNIDYCINCAAYTNVEKAESEKEKAFLINANAVKNLADICRKNRSVLFHISTDYVFNGNAQMPYLENDPTDPINVYGASKLKGEECIRQMANSYFIFRTSWLYSQYGHNFYKTVLGKAKKGEEMNITAAQTGTPTNANHLAQLIIKIIKENNQSFGTYHFSNGGETSWYGFAKEILKVSNNPGFATLNQDDSYKTIAARPAYSVLDKTKVEKTFNIEILSWQDALQELSQRHVN